nr:hypothetical protein [uncultured Erwinia sp.]
MDAGESQSRAMDGPALAVRPADERSEGTAQRREDRPSKGATSPLEQGASIEQPVRENSQSAETLNFC